MRSKDDILSIREYSVQCRVMLQYEISRKSLLVIVFPLLFACLYIPVCWQGKVYWIDSFRKKIYIKQTSRRRHTFTFYRKAEKPKLKALFISLHSFEFLISEHIEFSVDLSSFLVCYERIA